MSIELNNHSTRELLEIYSNIISTLKDRGVIRTKNLIGDLGEYLAIEKYISTPNLPKLLAAPAGTQNIDAISTKGERYSIKSTTGNLTGVFYGLNPPDSEEIEDKKFEYVIIVLFNENFKLSKILEINWNQFLNLKKWHKTMNAWNLSITKSLLSQSKIIYESK